MFGRAESRMSHDPPLTLVLVLILVAKFKGWHQDSQDSTAPEHVLQEETEESTTSLPVGTAVTVVTCSERHEVENPHEARQQIVSPHCVIAQDCCVVLMATSELGMDEVLNSISVEEKTQAAHLVSPAGGGGVFEKGT